jgi:predicted CXXCH cytochrome family protein
MMKESSPAPVSKMIIILYALILMTAELPTQFAWGMQTLSRPESNETCLFTLQLKEDPAIKKRYISMVILATQRNSQTYQSVDEMYANVSKISVEEDDGGYLPSLLKYNSRRIGSAQDIDNLSALCMECHDGLSAHMVTLDVRNNPFRGSNTVSSTNVDHPIGMDYNRYVISGKGYKSIINNSKMIFSDGKVGCLTCHDPFNPEKGHLVMSDVRSALCLTCHNK